MFKPSVNYEWKKQLSIMKTYRLHAEGCECSPAALHWYKKGLAYNQVGEKFGMHDYHYFFYHGEHSEVDMQKQKEFFLKAIECFKRSAEQGNDIAMAIYGLYLYHFCTSDMQEEALAWFQRASDKGLAIASYAVACCYHHGYGVQKSRVKSKQYMELFEKQWQDSLRQRALALHLTFDMELPSRGRLYTWCSGSSYIGATDLPGYMPLSWLFKNEKFGEPHFDIQLETDVMDGVPGDDYFMEYYYM